MEDLAIEEEKNECEEYNGVRERQGGPENSQQCGIWRVLVLMSASQQHAMQFSCRLHHQSVSRMKPRTKLSDCFLARLFPLT